MSGADATGTGPASVKEIGLAVRDRVKRHQAPIFAAAVAFFAFLALIPTLTGFIGIYGLVSDPDDVTEQVGDLLEGAPEATRGFLIDQMESTARRTSGALRVSVVLSITLALLSASGAVANLIKSLNVAYELDETRKPWTLRGLALLLMMGAVLVLSMVLFLLHAVPPLMSEVGIGGAGKWLIHVLRFPLLGVLMAGALSILYRVGPDHRGNDRPLSPRLLTTGGLVATVLFVVLSALFSFYTANLGSYGETYGPLATIIVLLLWFQLSALSFMVGAEVDAVLSDRAWRQRTGLEDPAARVSDGVSAAERLMAAMSAHDPAAVLACWNRRGIEHHPLLGELAVPDQLNAHLTRFFAAFPDLTIEVLEHSGTDDQAIVRYHQRGCFCGSPWDGVDANGKEIDLDVVCFLDLEDGYVVRNDVLFDTALLSSQLGFRPGERSRTRRVRAGWANVRTRVRNRRAERSRPDHDVETEVDGEPVVIPQSDDERVSA